MSYVLLSVLALFTVGVNSMTVLPKCSLAAEEYVYRCNGDALLDFRGSLECLIHSELDISLNKQYSMGTCREAVFGELQALGTYMKSLNVAVDDVEELETNLFPLWCKVRIMSVECYEPAYMRVCGLAARRFIHGIYGNLDKFMEKAFGHAINCTKPAAALGHDSGPEINFPTPEVPTHNITNTGSGLKPPIQIYIDTLKKSVQEIREVIGPCNVVEAGLSGGVCFFETIAADGKGTPSMHITNMVQYVEVLCESSMQFEKCVLPKMCGQNFMTDAMDVLDSSCGMFAAVKEEKQRGCYLPSSVTLDLKTLCGYGWYDFQYQMTAMNQPADLRRILDQYDLLMKPLQCMVDHHMAFVMSHLPAGCSDDVRAKVKDAEAKMKTVPHIFSEMTQSVRKLLSQIPMLSRGRNTF